MVEGGRDSDQDINDEPTVDELDGNPPDGGQRHLDEIPHGGEATVLGVLNFLRGAPPRGTRRRLVRWLQGELPVDLVEELARAVRLNFPEGLVLPQGRPPVAE